MSLLKCVSSCCLFVTVRRLLVLRQVGGKKKRKKKERNDMLVFSLSLSIGRSYLGRFVRRYRFFFRHRTYSVFSLSALWQLVWNFFYDVIAFTSSLLGWLDDWRACGIFRFAPSIEYTGGEERTWSKLKNFYERKKLAAKSKACTSIWKFAYFLIMIFSLPLWFEFLLWYRFVAQIVREYLLLKKL